MNTFTNTTVQSVLDKVCAWEMDKAVSSTHRTTKKGEHLFFARTKLTTRFVVWAKVDGKVQRREYQRNRRTGVTTLYVDYYVSQSFVKAVEKGLNYKPAWVK